MSLVDGSQTAYGLQEKPHDRGRSPPGPEDNYTSGAAISSTTLYTFYTQTQTDACV